MRALLGLQLAILVVAGSAVVAGVPRWALVDERAHFAYVQTVADEQRLPWLGRDRVAPEIDAMDPGPLEGLAAESYEAFQPPLAYVVAAPLYALPVSEGVKLRLLRGWGLVLLLVAVALLYRLSRHLALATGVRARLLLSGALCFVLWPGVITRAVTFSNAPLESVLVLGTLLLAWDARDRRQRSRLFAAAAVAGLALLTRSTAVLVLIPLAYAAWVFPWRIRLAALALPFLLLAPWVVSNVDRYGAVTASALVRDMQEPFLNPTGADYGVGDVRERHATLLRGVLPEEWWSQLLSTPRRWAIEAFLLVLMLAPPGLAWRARIPARLWWFGVAPLATGLVLMTAGLLAGNWDFFYPRYLYAVLPGLGLFAAAAVARGAGERVLLRASWAVTVVLAAVWLGLATVPPFTV